VIAVVHAVRLAAAQKDALVRLLRSSRGEGPTAIVARLLWCEGETVHLIALWESSDALDRYLATAEVPAVAEMLAMLGAQAPRSSRSRSTASLSRHLRSPSAGRRAASC
jgi:quinol monooxygenase YgiN